SFLVLLKQLPPAPALFPYTTLFRSDQREHAAAHAGLEHRGVRRGLSGLRDPERADPRLLQQLEHRGVVDVVERIQVAPSQRNREDRKSTRLNSSHVKISYAVFCLKK